MDDAARAMDRMYRLQRHIYDATRKYYLLGRDRVVAELAVPDGGAVLELGCGTARNLIKIARRYPAAHCYGIDASEEMLRTARAAVAQAGLSDRVHLAQGLAQEVEPTHAFGPAAPADGRFDRVLFSYALSIIPPWRESLSHGERLTKDGGSLHIVDFSDLGGYPALARRALRAWLGLFHVAYRPDLAAEMAALSTARARGFNVQHPLGRYYVLARMDAKAT